MANLSKAAIELRRRLPPHFTQASLAKRIGVTDQAVSNWMTGRSRPEPENMAALETVLGIPMRDWVEAGEAPSGTDLLEDDDTTHAETG